MATTTVLFNKLDPKIFTWPDVRTWAIRSQYNELLNLVIEQDFYVDPYKDNLIPNYYKEDLCLALSQCFSYYPENLLESLLIDRGSVTKLQPGFDALRATVDVATKSKSTSRLDANRKMHVARQELIRAAIDVNASEYPCLETDVDLYQRQRPRFHYRRRVSLTENVLDGVYTHPNGDKLDLNLDTSGLTVGACLWLYYYERMGIFKILSALMDDYNYRGKYPISGKLRDDSDPKKNYAPLMDAICTLYRLGIASGLRDRICTYQKVLGVTIENNLGIESERNTGFMQSFNKLIDYQVEYYKAKQLAQAIQAQNGNGQSRSSVATQTSIRDTMNVLQQQFEPFQYGRNQINVFLGIATVYATICLVRMLKAEIGIPNQYNKPEEFIPAAYDILVSKRPMTLNDMNRFIIYDNCASYGYRLLTDIEAANISDLNATSVRSNLDIWLDDIEGVVEGYRNAYSAVPEKAEAIV